MVRSFTFLLCSPSVETLLLTSCVSSHPNYTAWNLKGAKRLGVEKQVHVHLLSFEQLPVEWTGNFDLVISQESICHAYDKQTLFANLFHMLKPGGKLVFSDITEGKRSGAFSNGGCNGSSIRFLCFMFYERTLNEIKTAVNAVSGLLPSQQYRDMMMKAGFCQIESVDMSHHLAVNFSKMLKQLLKHCDLGEKRVSDFAESLRFRLANTDVISWNFFWATKREKACRIFCSAKLEREWFANVGFSFR